MTRLNKSNSQLISRFGILTDIQYANTDNRPANYDSRKIRYYRNSHDQIKSAFNYWNQLLIKPSFVLQLGDIIDVVNVHQNLNRFEAMSQTLKIFKDYSSIPTFHTLGNHELYNFKRFEIFEFIKESLMITSEEVDFQHPMGLSLSDTQFKQHPLYYKFYPVPGLKVISLDCYDISVLGYDSHNSNYQKAAQLLFKYHGHYDWACWDSHDNLSPNLDIRFTSQNGALSEEQLDWLDQELNDSDYKNEKVIVFGHVGLHPDSCDWSCLLWNYDKVLEIFHRHKSVISYLSGHAHASGHCVDKMGIHYIVFHGIIETTPETKAFATLSLFEDKIEIEGEGNEQTYNLNLTSSLSQHSNQFTSSCRMTNSLIQEKNESCNLEEEVLVCS